MSKSIIIAGTNSGCGKTTITIGLLALLKRKGYNVAPFKTGPDFIDPLFHKAVCGNDSYNLDSVMLDQDVLKELYEKHSRYCDISVIEGVMGMYDGLFDDSQGSAAHISKILNIPVVLVVNCKSVYQSVAAIVKGFTEYDPDVKVKGVFLNNVHSADQYNYLKSLIESKTDTRCIGYLPPNKRISLESRHLGLVQAEEVTDLDKKMEILVDQLEHTVDIESLLEISECSDKENEYTEVTDIFKQDLSGLKIAVAYDKAFRFYYKDNLELLEECGAELHYFSPLNDQKLPIGVNSIYIGGGYPEVFAQDLAQNIAMIDSILGFINAGGSVYAECGGMMYLTDKITTLDEKFYPMLSVFNCEARMTNRLKRFGYVEVKYEGEKSISHEFHRSELLFKDETNFNLKYKVKRLQRNMEWECGLSKGNVLGAYAHIHFYSNPDFFKKICELWKKTTI